MGKGIIKSDKGDGLYTLEIVLDRGDLDQRMAALEEQVAEFDDRIADKDDVLSGLRDDFLQAEDAEKRIEVKSDISAVQNLILKLKAQRLSASKSLEFLKNNTPDNDIADAWCADLTDGLSGEVGTAEVPGKRGVVQILPGYEDGAAYNADRDGILQPAIAANPFTLYFNLCLFPAWRKWLPTFRHGEIIDLDGSADTCDVQLDPVVGVQSINCNQSETLTGIPIIYMDCNSSAFDIGDRVLVEFSGQKWSGAQVIGFETDPQPCEIPEFLFIVLQGYDTSDGYIIAQNYEEDNAYQETFYIAILWDINKDKPITRLTPYEFPLKMTTTEELSELRQWMSDAGLGRTSYPFYTDMAKFSEVADEDHHSGDFIFGESPVWGTQTGSETTDEQHGDKRTIDCHDINGTVCSRYEWESVSQTLENYWTKALILRGTEIKESDRDAFGISRAFKSLIYKYELDYLYCDDSGDDPETEEIEYSCSYRVTGNPPKTEHYEETLSSPIGDIPFAHTITYTPAYGTYDNNNVLSYSGSWLHAYCMNSCISDNAVASIFAAVVTEGELEYPPNTGLSTEPTVNSLGMRMVFQCGFRTLSDDYTSVDPTTIPKKTKLAAYLEGIINAEDFHVRNRDDDYATWPTGQMYLRYKKYYESNDNYQPVYIYNFIKYCEMQYLAPQSREFKQLAALINAERAKEDLEPLTFDFALGRAAQNHADDIAENQYQDKYGDLPLAERILYYHKGSDGSSIGDRAEAVGYNLGVADWEWGVGENIVVFDYENPSTPEEMVAGWMASPPHRANIMDERFREIGFGKDSGGPSPGWTYIVNVFGVNESH